MSDADTARQIEALNKQFQQAIQAMRAGKPDLADQMLSDLLVKAPGHAGAMNGLGLLAVTRGDRKEAERLWRKAIQTAPDFASPYINLGNLERRTAPVSAVSHYQKGIALAPNDSQAVFALATLLDNLDRMADAAAVAEDGLKRFPNHSGLTAIVAKNLMEQARAQDALNLLDGVSTEGLPDRVAQLVLYTKAAVLDRADLPGEALAAAEEGADVLRRLFPEEIKAAPIERATMGAVSAFYKGRDLPRDAAGKGSDLVFLIGFPSSGTERLSKVLRHHPKIRLRDNTNGINNAIKEAFGEPAIPQPISDEKLDICRSRYETSLGVVADKGFVRVDDLPMNLVYAGVAAELFPGARFILCERDPAAACLAACMRGYEVSPASAALLTFDGALDFHKEATASWGNVSKALADRTLTVSYPDLSRRPKEVLEEVLEFMGLSGNAAGEAISALEEDHSPPLGDWRRYEEFLPKDSLAKL